MILKKIMWRGSSSEALGSMKYSFIANIHWPPQTQRSCICRGIINRLNRSLGNLFALNWNTLNHLTVCKQMIIIYMNTCNHITACRLSVLDRNTWNLITMYKQMIVRSTLIRTNSAGLGPIYGKNRFVETI